MLVLPWSHVVFGSLIGPAVGIGALWLTGVRHARTLVVAAIGVCGGTWLWNSLLNVRHAVTVDGDIPFRPFPISWQDVGTGAFAFAFAAGLLLATVLRRQPGSRTLHVAGLAAIAALIMDIYTW